MQMKRETEDEIDSNKNSLDSERKGEDMHGDEIERGW